MKNLNKYISFIIFFLSATINIQSAELTDSEGYPIFYLRGTQTGGWAANESYRFNREGSKYSIHLNQLSGEFKISNADWSINFGNWGEKLSITSSVKISGVQNGANFSCESLSDVGISFKYVKDSGMADIEFTINNQAIPSITSGSLPILYINVYNENGGYNNEVIDRNLSHKEYFKGEYWLDINDCAYFKNLGYKNVGSEEEPLPLQIKARGNFTRIAFAKKPFKLKLDKKQSLLGMSKSKHYAILAHADDNKGYLRNFIGFRLGKKIGLPWTPTQQPIEVVINGDYRGIYFLTESIRVEEDRVNIRELADNEDSGALISGGYIVELDNYDEENQIRMEEKSCIPGYHDMLRITFDTPEIYSSIQKRFVTEQFSAINNFIGQNSDEVWKYLDLDDVVRYYLVEELISHIEAFHGSTYLYRDFGEGEKWHFSPLWDCGNAFNGPTDGYFYNHAPYGATWIASLRENNRFNQKLNDTWKWFMSTHYDEIFQEIEDYVTFISTAARADRVRWQFAPTPENGIGVSDNSDMEKRKNTVINHLRDKRDWLVEQWGSYEGTHNEPERDLTPAAALPEYADINVYVDSPEDYFINDSDVVFYNLTGIQIERPQSGTICIARIKNKYRKIICR